MVLNLIPKENKMSDIFSWHEWFAIFPITTIDNEFVWLKFVERKREWVWYGTSPDQCILMWVYQKI